MLDFRKELSKLSLDETNSIVINSGILNALGIRESHDIDISVNEEVFEELKSNKNLNLITNEFGRPMLVNDTVDISLGWVQNSNLSFIYEDLLKDNCTVVIDGVRYLNLETLLEGKKLWGREKDKEDVKLIERYLKKNREL
jgi:predicted nucleotidyltransferase